MDKRRKAKEAEHVEAIKAGDEAWSPKGGFDMATGLDSSGNAMPKAQPDPIQNMKNVNKAFRAELYNNGTGRFTAKLKDAQEKQLRFLKYEKYLPYDKVVTNSDNNSEEHQLAQKGKTDVEARFQSIAAVDSTIGNQIEETSGNINNISDANNPNEELLVNQVATGNCEIEINEDGDKIYNCVNGDGENVSITENELSDIQNNIIPKAHKIGNDLITIANGFMEKLGIGKGRSEIGVTAEDNDQKVNQSIWTALNVPSDASDQDPKRIINQKKSMIADSLVGKPSLSDWLMSKEGLGIFAHAFPNAQSMGPWELLGQMNDELDEGNSELFDQVSLPYIKDQYFPQLKDKVTKNIPGDETGVKEFKEKGTADAIAWAEQWKKDNPPGSFSTNDKRDPMTNIGYDNWKAQGNEGTIEDFTKESNEWWDSPAGQAYAKKNDYKHRINEGGGITTDESNIVEDNDATKAILDEYVETEEKPKELSKEERLLHRKELGAGELGGVMGSWKYNQLYDAFGNKK